MRRPLSATAALLILALGAPRAYCDPVDEATQLLRKGAAQEALTRLDHFLKSNPKDARGRFLKGVILTEQNKANEAIAAYRALSEDMPELPEPYNNLGVLYAAQGRYDEARRAFEMAVLADPKYSLAHENLGDIHARMAGLAYDRARKLNTKSSSAAAKLKLVDQLLTPQEP